MDVREAIVKSLLVHYCNLNNWPDIYVANINKPDFLQILTGLHISALSSPLTGFICIMYYYVWWPGLGGQTSSSSSCSLSQGKSLSPPQWKISQCSTCLLLVRVLSLLRSGRGMRRISAHSVREVLIQSFILINWHIDSNDLN